MHLSVRFVNLFAKANLILITLIFSRVLIKVLLDTLKKESSLRNDRSHCSKPAIRKILSWAVVGGCHIWCIYYGWYLLGIDNSVAFFFLKCFCLLPMNRWWISGKKKSLLFSYCPSQIIRAFPTHPCHKILFHASLFHIPLARNTSLLLHFRFFPLLPFLLCTICMPGTTSSFQCRKHSSSSYPPWTPTSSVAWTSIHIIPFPP